MTQAGAEETELYNVRRPKKPVHWEVTVPGSKSMTNRALLMAALAEGTARVTGALFSDDTRVFLAALRALGFTLAVSEEEACVTVEGRGGRIPRSEAEIDVGSSGTAARFLTVLLGTSDGMYRIGASAQMQARPMRPLFDALLSLGAEISWLGEKWHLPVELTGAGAKARRTDAAEAGTRTPTVTLDISESTQFLSAFLLSAPRFPAGLRIHVSGEKKDGPYVAMTCRMMRECGIEARFVDGDYLLPAGAAYHVGTYAVEPDVSAACYFYAAAAVTGGYVRVNGIYADSMQGDIKFLAVLEDMGCAVAEEPEGIAVTGPAPGTLRGISVDMRDFSDQALTLAAIAPYANGPVRIMNIAHVRQQESDRIHAMAENLRRAGIPCAEFSDGVEIRPGQPKSCRIATFSDHRVAMAFAVTGLGADGVVIEDPACCAKTFENYFTLLDSLTAGETPPEERNDGVYL